MTTREREIEIKYEKEFALFIDSKIEALRSEIRDLEIVKRSKTSPNSFILKVTKVEQPGVDVQHEDGVYHPDWTWIKKITHLLKENGEMTTTDLVGNILKREPERNSNRDKVVASVSAVMSIQSRPEKAVFLKRKNARGENVFNLNPEKQDSDEA